MTPTTAILVRRAVLATPLGLAPLVMFALFEVVERGEWEAAGAALCRAVLLVGPVCPLLIVVIVVVALRSRGVWMAMRLLGHDDRALLVPLVAVGLGVAVVLTALAWVLPAPGWTDALPPMPVASGEGWLVPLGERHVYVEPVRGVVELVASPPPRMRGAGWTEAQRWTLAARSAALLTWAPWWMRLSLPDGTVSSAGAFAGFLAVASLAVLGQSILGLLVQAGVLGAWWVCGALGAMSAVGLVLWRR